VVSKGLNRYLSILLEESVDFGSMDLLHEEEQIKEKTWHRSPILIENPKGTYPTGKFVFVT